MIRGGLVSRFDSVKETVFTAPRFLQSEKPKCVFINLILCNRKYLKFSTITFFIN